MKYSNIITSIAMYVVWGFAVPVSAEPDSPVIKINEAAAKSDIEVIPLRGSLYTLMGSGGNIVVLAGQHGKFLVDSGISVSKEKLKAALQGINSAPLKYLVNTHWHWDHTDGNPWVQKQGATVIGHANTLKHLSQTTAVKDWNYTFEPLPAESRPTILVAQKKVVDFEGEQVQIENFGRGHTDGDLWVYFTKNDVLVLGDTFWNGMYPFIDNDVGGGIDQTIKWVNLAISSSTDSTVIVPGHGPVGNRGDLIAFRDMLVSIRDNVATLKSQGMTLGEVQASKPTAAFDERWGKFVINPDLFTKLVYQGL